MKKENFYPKITRNMYFEKKGYHQSADFCWKSSNLLVFCNKSRYNKQ